MKWRDIHRLWCERKRALRALEFVDTCDSLCTRDFPVSWELSGIAIYPKGDDVAIVDGKITHSMDVSGEAGDALILWATAGFEIDYPWGHERTEVPVAFIDREQVERMHDQITALRAAKR